MSSSEKLEQARRHYIESLAETMEMYGLSPSMGRLFGIMFFHDEPMTLDEMRKLTGMSKTSMSTGVRALSRLKLVHKKWQKGVRKDLYEAEHDQFRSFVDFFSQLWEKEIELNQKNLTKTERNLKSLLQDPELTPEERDQVEEDLEKLKRARRYYTWLDHLVDAFESGDIFKYVPIPDEEAD
ncbi:DNA-binding transcriptional regulator GbsR (MarR family) [Melghirimyces profundicolus]|uniref:HTH-type transcriptional regulator n=1 Tax=Melghirimyces profundicolus TaxID=1242148 RepID=A0A2T6BG24_9BACL|nr:GbsR/MarR family transcriptional regulator [Melghirimyces profundicolus]PTX55007.1 DNA-binding transcriptional regulator GbsR (MarR family) [Melghirimyces profundicolus]